MSAQSPVWRCLIGPKPNFGGIGSTALVRFTTRHECRSRGEVADGPSTSCLNPLNLIQAWLHCLPRRLGDVFLT